MFGSEPESLDSIPYDLIIIFISVFFVGNQGSAQKTLPPFPIILNRQLWPKLCLRNLQGFPGVELQVSSVVTGDVH